MYELNTEKSFLFYCSFCGRWEEKGNTNGVSNKLIIGPKVSICEQCVKDCVEFLKSEKELENET